LLNGTRTSEDEWSPGLHDVPSVDRQQPSHCETGTAEVSRRRTTRCRARERLRGLERCADAQDLVGKKVDQEIELGGEDSDSSVTLDADDVHVPIIERKDVADS
jgi:hypothetical protein